MNLDWKILFDNCNKACMSFFYYMQSEIYETKNAKIDYTAFKYVLDKCFPNGISSDYLFEFIDSKDILVGVYPKHHEDEVFYISFAKSNYSYKVYNDLHSRHLANKQAIECAFELLQEKIEKNNLG